MLNKKQIDSNTSLRDLYSQIDQFTNYFRVVQEKKSAKNDQFFCQ